MEILDLYDDNYQKLNETIVRGTKTEQGKNIMLSVIFIRNEDGEYLIQKTSKEKGNRYSSTGGHVIHGEDGLTTIGRELKEELNIEVSSENIKYIATFKYPSKACIFNVYLLKQSKRIIDQIQLQEEEVESIKWMKVSEIYDIIKQGNFLESHAFIFSNYICSKEINN